jgi:hypothetical protein
MTRHAEAALRFFMTSGMVAVLARQIGDDVPSGPCVNGQQDLPMGGQWNCPVVAIRSAHWRPVVLLGLIWSVALLLCLVSLG